MDPLPEVQPGVAPASLAAADATRVNVICPSCGAELKNVRAEAGVKIRCLNCNAKFLPPAAGVSAGSALPGTAPAEVSPRQEPRTPGYWLLRIPSIIVCGAAFFIMALTLYTFAASSGYSSAIGNLLQLSYIPLIGCGGLVLFLLTRALPRIDRGGVSAAWRAGILTGPLPPPRGSSLPYIAPLALSGGLFPIVMVGSGSEHPEAILAAAVYGALLFYTGVALEDVRQFIWRQEVLARECCRAAGISFVEPHLLRPTHAGTVLAVAAALGGGACIFFSMNSWRRNDMFLVFNGLSLLACAISLFMLGRDGQRAVALWRLAGGRSEQPTTSMFSLGFPWVTGLITITCIILWTVMQPEFDPYTYSRRRVFSGEGGFVAAAGMLFLAFFALKTLLYFRPQPAGGLRLWAGQLPLFWTGIGVLWLMLLFFQEGGVRYSGNSDFIALTMMFASFGALAIALSMLVSQVYSWHQSQERYWRAQNAPGSRFIPPSRWESIFCRGVVWLSIAEAALFLVFILNEIGGPGKWELIGVIGFPLLIAMMHYPAVWLATVLEEFLTLESLYSGKPDADE